MVPTSSPNESIQISGIPQEFCRKWGLRHKYSKSEQILFNVQNRAGQNQSTDKTKNSKYFKVSLDRNMRIKSHVFQLKALNILTSKKFDYLETSNQTMFSIEIFQFIPSAKNRFQYVSTVK